MTYTQPKEFTFFLTRISMLSTAGYLRKEFDIVSFIDKGMLEALIASIGHRPTLKHYLACRVPLNGLEINNLYWAEDQRKVK